VFCGKTGVTKGHIWPDWLSKVLPRVGNGGWMSQIENNSKAYATRLIHGAEHILDPKGQKALATLLCLITIRVEFTELNTLSVTSDDRTWLRENLEPPPLWQIWIARYIGNQLESHWCRHYGMQLVSSPDDHAGPGECNTQTTTLVLGQLCAHTFSSSVFPEFSGYKGTLFKIWPISGFDINTAALPPVGDDDVVSLSEALARGMKPIPE